MGDGQLNMWVCLTWSSRWKGRQYSLRCLYFLWCAFYNHVVLTISNLIDMFYLHWTQTKTNINHDKRPHNMMSTTFNIVHMSSCRNSRCTISSTYWIEPTGKWSEDRNSYRRQHRSYLLCIFQQSINLRKNWFCDHNSSRRQHRSHLLLSSSDRLTWGRIDFVTIIHVGDNIGVISWSMNPAIDQRKGEFILWGCC